MSSSVILPRRATVVRATCYFVDEDEDGVDALVDQRLSLLHEGAAEHDHAGGAVADLVALCR